MQLSVTRSTNTEQSRDGWSNVLLAGVLKRAMETLVPESSDEESEQLRRLLLRYIPRRV
jgi:hypothetical protein